MNTPITRATSSINSRNVAIVVFDEVEVLDFAGPYEVFSVAATELPAQPYPPFITYTVGLSGNGIIARGGLRVTPDYSLANCPAPDVLLVPGGAGSRRLLKHGAFLEWLLAQAENVEVLCSVCTGALALAAAGLLQGRRATTHHCAFDQLAGIDASITVVQNERFVQDESIWTSGGISAGIDMSLALVKHLVGDTKPVIEEMEWLWHQVSRK